MSRLVVLGLAAVSVTTAMAVPAASAAPAFNAYVISRGAATFTKPGTGNLFPGGVDDAVAQVFFPFQISMFGHNRSSAYVSSNGNIQFATQGGPSAKYQNTCLPDTDLAAPVVAVYYDDILIRNNGQDGVFTRTVGSYPNRRYVVSWLGTDYSTTTVPVKVQAVFYERKQYFDMVYGDGDGYDATIGVQNNLGDTTQFLCNPGRHNVVQSGERLRFTFTTG